MLLVRLPAEINFAGSRSFFAGRRSFDFGTKRRFMRRRNIALFTLLYQSWFLTFEEIWVFERHRSL